MLLLSDLKLGDLVIVDEHVFDSRDPVSGMMRGEYAIVLNIVFGKVTTMDYVTFLTNKSRTLLSFKRDKLVNFTRVEAFYV